METLLRIGLSNSVAALILALAILVVACVWRRPALLHALWILVVVKLVTPPLVWLPDPWPDAPATLAAPEPAPAPVAPPAEAASADPPADAAAADAQAPQWIVLSAPDAAPDADSGAPAPRAPGESRSASPTIDPAPAGPWWMPAAGAVWLAGAVGWYALALHRLRRFHGLLRHAVPAPESLRQRTQRLAEKMGLRRCPAVWLIPGRVAPMLWAAGGRPRILFPAELLEQLGVDQQNALIVHELAHLRRRDHCVRWLEFAAAGLYWWNPVLWLARRELREAEEQCCDAWVTSTLRGAGKTYASALLETLDFLSDAPRPAPLLASGVGRVADLKRRLTMIMRGTTPRALSWRGFLAVLGAGALLLPLLPAWARAQEKPKAEEPPKQEAFFFKFLDNDSPPSQEDAAKMKDVLKTLEAQLEQKQAEVAELKAKLEAVRAKLGAAGVGSKEAGPLKGRIVIQAGSDVDIKKMQEVIKQLQAAPGGASSEVIVIDQGSGKIIMKAEGANPQPGREVEVRVLQGKQGEWVVVPKDGKAAPQPADADKRLDELEMRLKKILNEVEELRHERRPGAPETEKGREDVEFRFVPAPDGVLHIVPAPAKEAGPHSYGPTPMEKIPYLKELFKANPGQVGEISEQLKELAAAREALLSQRRALEEKAQADSAQGQAALEQARAQLSAAEAALKQSVVRREQAPDKVNEADIAASKAALEQAKLTAAKMAEEKQARQAAIESALKAAELDRRAVEEKIKRLEEELRSLGDAPKKP